jgi:hypothetical protein
MTQSRALLVLALAALFAVPSLASAQATLQGQIIITEVQPTGPTVPPGYAPQQQVMVAPQVVAPQQMACPPGTTLMPDRYGQPACMEQYMRHRIHGGLLGGGIGLFAGGYVASILTTAVSGLIGAFNVAFGTSGYSASDLNTYFTFGYVPIIGPFVQLGFAPPNTDGGLYAWLVVEGLMQMGGLTMLIFGAIGEEYLDYRPIAGVEVQLRPMLSASTQGMSATVTF